MKRAAILRVAIAVGAAGLLASCSFAPSEKPQTKEYFSPLIFGAASPKVIDNDHAPVPKGGGRRMVGKPYQVAGKTYVPREAEDYSAKGVASWYGRAFHGRQTANGEVYDVAGLTAAHKTLPLPSYARVTNLDNGRSVIVRVNDRGPFHGDRLIDLSYAAAKKLGYQSRGTARVEVAAITVRPDGAMFLAGKPFDAAGQAPVVASQASGTTELAAGEGLFVQLGAFSQRDPAEAMRERLLGVLDNPVRVREITTDNGRFHRVQVGPFKSEGDARYAQNLLESRGFRQSIVLTDSH